MLRELRPRLLGQPLSAIPLHEVVSPFLLLEGLLLLRSELCLLSPAPIHTNTRGGDQNMQGIGCYAQKISMIEKTPTPEKCSIAVPGHCQMQRTQTLFQIIYGSMGWQTYSVVNADAKQRII